MDWSKCMDKDDTYALEQFHANIPKNRSTWTAPQGYFYAQHEYHHSNRGRNDNEFAPRKGLSDHFLRRKTVFHEKNPQDESN